MHASGHPDCGVRLDDGDDDFGRQIGPAHDCCSAFGGRGICACAQTGYADSCVYSSPANLALLCPPELEENELFEQLEDAPELQVE